MDLLSTFHSYPLQWKTPQNLHIYVDPKLINDKIDKKYITPPLLYKCLYYSQIILLCFLSTRLSLLRHTSLSCSFLYCWHVSLLMPTSFDPAVYIYHYYPMLLPLIHFVPHAINSPSYNCPWLISARTTLLYAQ